MEQVRLKYGPYSPSRLEAGTCGYAFKRSYIDKDPRARTQSVPASRGSVVHEVFEQITNKLKANPSYMFSKSEIRDWVVQSTNKYPAAYEEIEMILDMAARYIRRPPERLTSDAGVELKVAVKAEHNLEKDQLVFTECDYEDPIAFARGRADILVISDDTTEAIIYDHKTQPNAENADTFQMGIYAWTVWKHYPFLNSISTVLHFARYGTYSEEYKWSVEQLKEIEDTLLTRIQVLENRTDWGATPHKNCQYCPYIAQCPALEQFLTIDSDGRAHVKADNLQIFGDTNKAVQVAGMINVLEQMLGEGKDNLKEHIKNTGCAIAIPGTKYEFRAEEVINWNEVNKNPIAFENVLKKHGVNPETLKGYSQTFSKGIWTREDSEILLEEASAVLPKVTKTTFKGYKA